MIDPALLARVLEGAGRASRTFAAALGPVGIAAGLAVNELLQAAAAAMRDDGKSLEQIVKDIRAPRKIDLSFRGNVDAHVASLPDEPPPRKPSG